MDDEEEYKPSQPGKPSTQTRPERKERGFNESYSIGWRETNPLEEIRQFRTEIALNDTFQVYNRNGRLETDTLIQKTIESLKARYEFEPSAEYVTKTLVAFNLRCGHLQRDPKDPVYLIRG